MWTWCLLFDRRDGQVPLLPVTLDAPTLDALRIEAGIPQWGVDMDESTIPVEAGLAGRAISYDKGCYIGQETIARIKTYGHVNRCLAQVRVAGKLALRYVRRELAKPGTIVTVDSQPAEIIKLCGN